MTNQQAYKAVCEHLMKQGCYAEDSDANCVFRNSYGLKCAIGAIIPDSEYRSGMEGNADVEDLLDPASEWFVPSLCGLDLILLHNLQRVHDCIKVEDWPRFLRAEGNKCGFILPECIHNERRRS